ncbi:SapC family protein [Vreelandella zhaodongensis]|uniref:SapC family protein n=1 Tax=Vreelandella zhaodongensis TaxID=1176240 RepID=UPI003EC03D61
MADWVTVSRTDHANSGFLPRVDYLFSEDKPIAPLLVSELSHALPHYVMGFVKSADQFHLVVLLGRRQGGHVYVHPDGRWLGSYVPAALRGYPFALGRTDEGGHVLQIHEQHLTTEGGEPLFNTEGELSVKAQGIVDFLTQCEKNRQVTLKACSALADAGAIVPWEEGSGQWAKGLYRFDENVLNALSPSAYHSLRGVPMAIAHAQMFSMNQVEQLAQRAKLLEQYGQTPENLDTLFGNDDDELSFDFDS